MSKDSRSKALWLPTHGAQIPPPAEVELRLTLNPYPHQVSVCRESLDRLPQVLVVKNSLPPGAGIYYGQRRRIGTSPSTGRSR